LPTKPPKQSRGDVAHTVVKAALSVIPYAGGPAAELFQSVIVPPFQKRQLEWMEDLAERIEKLESKTGISPAELRDNPAFIDAALTAGQSAVRTSNREKREALRNAVINSVLKNAPPPDMQQLYLSILDSLSPWHIRLLYLFRDPVTWFRRAGRPFPDVGMGSLRYLVQAAYPETQAVAIQDVWSDLYSRGLVNTQELAGTMSGSGLTSVRTTPLGGAIVEFTINHLDDE
jgi:hypothetical protein